MKLIMTLGCVALLGAGCSIEPKTETRSAVFEHVVQDAGRLAVDEGKAGRPHDILTTTVASTDQYGATSYLSGPVFQWSPADLECIRWGGVDPYRVMDLAVVRWPMGERQTTIRSMSSWCESADGAVLTPRLCQNWRALVAEGV